MTIDWPPQFPRTSAEDRQPNNRFDTSLRQSIDDLADELERVGADDWRLETAAEHQKRNPRYPYADASPDDPGAVVRWTMDGDQYAAACDAYTRLRDNIRSLYKYIHEKRKMESRPVTTGESEFANARLPPADQEIAVEAEPPAHVVLGVDPNAGPEDIRQAYRRQAIDAHPDNGGSKREFRRLKRAKEQLLEEVAA
ncbi:heat shock protein DnaJ domain protein (plasmid) [Haloterrigena turkmenica DSM 5511]|uniref:Heat shock protein DnaJ domain protein n=1 Tax=Haloterrigena turkmenica (strain ATCC 51198 / DSM 5511 / JCM 9101 / NCIMB 13204 / VKM B-1734 / 4k) TaxID=543526 RepID=D2S3M1_HALTV|nr:DnaJ domain-containing protein [Haloterrigena turkmenica]ADB63968.1 heat shock protein DnaJ domain protein [Haloterrigena turkmenica DSM 5511]